MTYSVFNHETYLDLEAARQEGQSEVFDLGATGTVGLIARSIPQSDYHDLVSVYGYPDLSMGTAPIDIDLALENLTSQARPRGHVAAYIRLGLSQQTPLPRVTALDYTAVRVDVGEVVAVDLASGPDATFAAYRKNLRNELRRETGIKIERSNDFAAFHAIYTQNMLRVGATGGYFFSEPYLRTLGELPGVELWLAHDADGVVAGGMFITQGDLTFYHLGATADRALRASPLKNLLHSRIQALAGSGQRQLVLGGGVGGGDDPLLRFKRGFSKTMLPVHALRVIVDHAKYTTLSGHPADAPLAAGFFPAYRAPK